MKRSGRFRIVLVTCATLTEARKIARHAVSKRLAGCVNITRSPIESLYIWKGKLEKSPEHLLVMKTTKKCLAELEKQVKRLHSYEISEFLVLPIAAGSNDYLSWLDESVKPSRK